MGCQSGKQSTRTIAAERASGELPRGAQGAQSEAGYEKRMPGKTRRRQCVGKQVLPARNQVADKLHVGGAVSRFPSSDIDLAFVVPESVPAGSVLTALRRAGGDLLESVNLFDVYRGDSVPEGTRSLAYHLRFCALDRTLTDDEVGVERARCIEAVESAFGATLR